MQYRDEKLLTAVTFKVGETMVKALDEYVGRRSKEARIRLTRSQAVRELLESLLEDDRFVAI
ncbi:MAG: hypothetical protein AAGF12_22525 [Myxococcota bacterium]